MAHGNEINSKRFYWLKMDRHFFNDARIKKMRKLPKGDTCAIIYQKLLLLSVEYGGVLVFEHIEDTFEKEMALKLEEKEAPTEATIQYLKQQGMLVPVEEKDDEFFLIQAQNSIGSETKSNVYKRQKRGENVRLEKFQPHSNQIPIEKEIDIDTELDINEERKKENIYNNPSSASARTCEETDFSKMTDEELLAWGKRGSVDFSDEGSYEQFWDYYEECRKRGGVKKWNGKIIKGNGTLERLKSHDEILSDYGVSEKLRDVYFRFLKHCFLNGHLVPNDKLESIIINLDERYGTDPDADEYKIKALETAMSGGYFDVRHW